MSCCGEYICEYQKSKSPFHIDWSVNFVKGGKAPLWVGCGGFSLLHRLRRCQPSFWQITTISLNWSEYHILWSSLPCKGKNHCFQYLTLWTSFALLELHLTTSLPWRASRAASVKTLMVLDDGWLAWDGQRHKNKKGSRNRMCPTQNIQNVR